MTKIVRKGMKIFGSAAGVNQIGQFGSLAASAPAYTTDPDVIQGLGNYLTGWYGAVIGANSPALQDLNAITYLYAYQLAYVMQAGVSEWNTDTTYYIGSLVNDGSGALKVSTVDSNTGNALTDGTKWASPPGQVPIGAVIATFPNLTGAYTTTATTVADVSGCVLCQGQTLADATSPMNGQVIPNINNSIFLMGSTTAGNTGGSNTSDLTHTHNFAHVHQVATSSGSAVNFMLGSADPSLTSFAYNSANVFSLESLVQSYASGSANFAFENTGNSNKDYYSAGAIDAPSGSGSSATTGGGGLTSFDNRPAFITAVYVMRVK